ncbi:MAG: MmgE/PrpD family protein [Pseudomonadota bacterium]|nr:MmgE/PrpD family protein [Pseudomonadota bacterium]
MHVGAELQRLVRLVGVKSASGSEPAARVLARFAAGLRPADLPASVVRRARHCIVDTLGVALHGATLPGSRIVIGHARRYGSGGPCTLLGSDERVQAPLAALANGASAHAFEQDSLRHPGAGVHPGAAVLPAALAIAEETGANAEQLLLAFVAAVEVMFRIGAASRHSSESLGFHAPGLTGPYGAAIAAGLLLRLDGDALTRALGIAGSLSAGLLAFAHAHDGAMVKRLHLGRAAESGVLAARLAGAGFDGPSTVLDGHHGFLEAYCRDVDRTRLTAGLMQEWETLRICFKAFPCHVTAHTPVQAVRSLMAAHCFDGHRIKSMRVFGAPKLLSHHNRQDPDDVMQAQYSVPFCVALAAFRDPADPMSWDERAVADAGIRTLCRRIELVGFPPGETPGSGWHTRLHIELVDGRVFSADGSTFPGMPEDPLDDAAVEAKFRRLAGALIPASIEALLVALAEIDSEDWRQP